jgi:hypothetical protein
MITLNDLEKLKTIQEYLTFEHAKAVTIWLNDQYTDDSREEQAKANQAQKLRDLLDEVTYRIERLKHERVYTS